MQSGNTKNTQNTPLSLVLQAFFGGATFLFFISSNLTFPSHLKKKQRFFTALHCLLHNHAVWRPSDVMVFTQ
jgi:RsiW-degrading membrane proteinase PrsW (M82 family)